MILNFPRCLDTEFPINIPRAEAHAARDCTLGIGVSPVIGRDDDREDLDGDEGDEGGRQPLGDLPRVRGADQRLAQPRVEGGHRGNGPFICKKMLSLIIALANTDLFPPELNLQTSSRIFKRNGDTEGKRTHPIKAAQRYVLYCN